jgi:hypothetical protein
MEKIECKCPDPCEIKIRVGCDNCNLKNKQIFIEVSRNG